MESNENQPQRLVGVGHLERNGTEIGRVKFKTKRKEYVKTEKMPGKEKIETKLEEKV